MFHWRQSRGTESFYIKIFILINSKQPQTKYGTIWRRLLERNQKTIKKSISVNQSLKIKFDSNRNWESFDVIFSLCELYMWSWQIAVDCNNRLNNHINPCHLRIPEEIFKSKENNCPSGDDYHWKDFQERNRQCLLRDRKFHYPELDGSATLKRMSPENK